MLGACYKWFRRLIQRWITPQQNTESTTAITPQKPLSQEEYWTIRRKQRHAHIRERGKERYNYTNITDQDIDHWEWIIREYERKKDTHPTFYINTIMAVGGRNNKYGRNGQIYIIKNKNYKFICATINNHIHTLLPWDKYSESAWSARKRLRNNIKNIHDAEDEQRRYQRLCKEFFDQYNAKIPPITITNIEQEIYKIYHEKFGQGKHEIIHTFTYKRQKYDAIAQGHNGLIKKIRQHEGKDPWKRDAPSAPQKEHNNTKVLPAGMKKALTRAELLQKSARDYAKIMEAQMAIETPSATTQEN